MKIIYVDLWPIISATDQFIYFFIGGRGIGKTYSVLNGILDNDIKFMYVRRTETELKQCVKTENNPFISLNRNKDRNVTMQPSGDGFIITEDDNMIGVAGAVSTFGKFRGSDYTDIEMIVFDEFIPKGSHRAIKDEALLFFDMLETVNRNRELEGKPPIKVVLLSNANTIDSDILRELKLREVIHRLKKTGQHIYTDDRRGIYLELIDGTGVAEFKKQTALYKLTAGTAFYDMAIENEFTGDSFDDVYKIPPSNLIPLVRLENVTFYQVKGDQPLIYASYRKADVPEYTKETLQAFKRRYGLQLEYYFINKKVVYYDYDIKLTVRHLFS